ncbi:murein biosynthesis integral membrane protein MurJ [Helicobacter sp. 11S02629-2]|uniref:murein biosynthesis integral membrane protein MurJ n=1 Tax=Helicobacter sp. 11S02629-2 TaxID=1476195 RepID=UPI000BA52E36|nr:murein biosynthesis integral membrane protein MurJ [Helicobacter sp. 11S02629-2]PAF44087.1 murein biosynthesis integral membrane protein MurJ [Helicobacter sp. 11S02629-2]
MLLRTAFLINISGILTSRIFGFLRDAMQAYVLGTSIYSDIFFLAFKFPNVFRRVFAEGAFTQSFLPYFLHSRKKGAFSVTIASIFGIFLIILSLLIMLFSPYVTRILGLGYSEDIIKLATPIVAINFWYLIFIFFVTYFSTLLQYKNIFWVNAYNTALLNIAMILALFFSRHKDLLDIVYILSYSVVIGGVAQVILHFYPLYYSHILRLQLTGFKSLFIWNLKKDKKSKRNLAILKEDIKHFFGGFFPAMLGSSTAQITSMIDTILVTFLPVVGGVSMLSYANRIFQLPLALFAIAISSALFPMIARALKNNEEKKALALLKKAFTFLLYMLSFCVLGGIMLSNEIIWLLYERGHFTRSSTLEVGLVFIGYLIGLLPFGLSRIFSLWLYSQKKQALSAKISAISLLIGLAFSLILMWHFSVFGLALAGSLGGFALFFMTIYFFGVKKFISLLDYKRLVLLLVLLVIEFIVIYLFKLKFSIT